MQIFWVKVLLIWKIVIWKIQYLGEGKSTMTNLKCIYFAYSLAEFWLSWIIQIIINQICF